MPKKEEAKTKAQKEQDPEVVEVEGGHDENLPATVDPAEMATTDEDDSGLDIDQEDIIIPRMSIVQPTSEEGTPGTYRLNLTGDEFNEVTCVFLKQGKGRVLFAENREDGVVCASGDRIKPSNHFIDQDTAMALTCADCQMKEWTGENQKTAPKCKETFILLGLDVENGIPFWLQLKSSALKPARMFISAAAFRIQKFKIKLCDIQVTLTTKEVKGQQGKYFVPVFGKMVHLKDQPFRGEAEIYGKESVSFEDKKPESEGEKKEGMPF